MSNRPVCRVEWPGDDAPPLWHGTYGNAVVVQGSPAVAVTSDGQRHAL